MRWRAPYPPSCNLLTEKTGGAPIGGSCQVDRDQLCTGLSGIRYTWLSISRLLPRDGEAMTRFLIFRVEWRQRIGDCRSANDARHYRSAVPHG
jgi:hypothetical protein